MAVTIEKQCGRARLLECMTDPRKLLPTCNRAAGERNAVGGVKLRPGSQELVGRFPPARD